MSMLQVEEAVVRVLALTRDLLAERVAVPEAMGRALTHPVIAQRTLPPWDNSAMDGYALIASDVTQVAEGPVRLAVTQVLHAGDRPVAPIEKGQCARIMTGAVVPAGADAVVMQERARAQDGFVELDEVPKPGQNIRRRGEDVIEGQVLLPQGRQVGIAEAGALWAQGLEHVQVARRPTVAIASSGDELCAVGEVPAGRIVDTNTPVLAELVKRAGGIPTVLGVAPDRLDAITETFGRGLSFDVLVTVSGASVGEKDYTREAFTRLGVSMDFWRVAMKPGKPLAVGRHGNTLVFGLPGNPVSAMVTFELFVRPALRRMQGLVPHPPTLPARLAAPIVKPAGLRLFARATVMTQDGELWATALPTQSSGALASAVGATHLISLSPDVTHAPQGLAVELIPLSWGA